MKNIKYLLFLFIMVSLTVFAEDEKEICKIKEISISPTHKTVVDKGKIKGHQCVSYNFLAKKGDVLTAVINTNNDADVVLFDSYDFIPGEKYIIPENGEYQLRVIHYKAAAIKNKISYYKIKINLQ
ncbi:hypothetical protein RCN20_16375 [Escherichia coli]|uniref:hypothetical protein n=1 Tax=Escherichia TaxID=561 RepID=UPI00092D8847|nr:MULTISPECIES: hypothetical protein [Escherichia]APL92869.1 hypothetical protein RG73_24020 [Escherichia coli]MDD8345032.1 hypothetical protein [Escherichia coli]MEC9860904.1 hypothetical protein [Escherichia coli]MED9317208.1 hypothetical protein [Escherichia coli]HAY0331071.1 hypothetical protein [Escherichia coli]